MKIHLALCNSDRWENNRALCAQPGRGARGGSRGSHRPPGGRWLRVVLCQPGASPAPLAKPRALLPSTCLGAVPVPPRRLSSRLHVPTPPPAASPQPQLGHPRIKPSRGGDGAESCSCQEADIKFKDVLDGSLGIRLYFYSLYINATKV